MNIRNLPLLGSLFLSGLLTLGACGSSSSSGTGGTAGPIGGGSGALGGAIGSTGGTTGAGGHVASTGGTTGAGGTTVTGSCTTVPSCLQAFVSCLPSGTCMEQQMGSAAAGTLQFNLCYSNGVRGTTTIDSAGNVMATVSKNGSVCYLETVTDSGAGGASGNPVITVKNPAGTTVATVTDSSDGNGTLVTCPGQAPVLLPDGCDMNTSPAGCTPGVCQ